jgi:hypothetical protein
MLIVTVSHPGFSGRLTDCRNPHNVPYQSDGPHSLSVNAESLSNYMVAADSRNLLADHIYVMKLTCGLNC